MYFHKIAKAPPFEMKNERAKYKVRLPYIKKGYKVVTTREFVPENMEREKWMRSSNNLFSFSSYFVRRVCFALANIWAVNMKKKGGHSCVLWITSKQHNIIEWKWDRNSKMPHNARGWELYGITSYVFGCCANRLRRTIHIWIHSKILLHRFGKQTQI